MSNKRVRWHGSPVAAGDDTHPVISAHETHFVIPAQAAHFVIPAHAGIHAPSSNERVAR
jgi:hypothetical protein